MGLDREDVGVPNMSSSLSVGCVGGAHRTGIIGNEEFLGVRVQGLQEVLVAADI